MIATPHASRRSRQGAAAPVGVGLARADDRLLAKDAIAYDVLFPTETIPNDPMPTEELAAFPSPIFQRNCVRINVVINALIAFFCNEMRLDRHGHTICFSSVHKSLRYLHSDLFEPSTPLNL